MALNSTVLNFLKTAAELDVRLLFQGELEFETSQGTNSTNLFRYVMDNLPDASPLQYDSQTWYNFPFETQDFIRKINQVSNPIEVILYDPSTYNLPGPIKNLLEDTRVLNRAVFTLMLILMDKIPGTEPAEYFYQSTQHTITLFKGKLNSPSATESSTNLGMVTQFDMLKDQVPSIVYSNTCPYTTGDGICTLYTTQLGTNNRLEKTVTVASDGITVTIDDGVIISVYNQTVDDYWALGAIVFTDNGLEGYAKGIIDCSIVNNKYQLTLESQVSSSGGGFTAVLHANCTKEFNDCKDRFGNDSNFGGQRSLIRVIGGANEPLTDV